VRRIHLAALSYTSVAACTYQHTLRRSLQCFAMRSTPSSPTRSQLLMLSPWRAEQDSANVAIARSSAWWLPLISTATNFGIRLNTVHNVVDDTLIGGPMVSRSAWIQSVKARSMSSLTGPFSLSRLDMLIRRTASAYDCSVSGDRRTRPTAAIRRTLLRIGRCQRNE
jgi:hypothetical protein